jgi:hypothetical protein
LKVFQKYREEPAAGKLPPGYVIERKHGDIQQIQSNLSFALTSKIMKKISLKNSSPYFGLLKGDL